VNGRPRSWTCKARERATGRPCGEELGIVEAGRLRVRIGLSVEAGPDGGVTVICPANFRHHRTWLPRGEPSCYPDREPPSAVLAGRVHSEARSDS
jgi:hypothetical protein